MSLYKISLSLVSLGKFSLGMKYEVPGYVSQSAENRYFIPKKLSWQFQLLIIAVVTWHFHISDGVMLQSTTAVKAE